MRGSQILYVFRIPFFICLMLSSSCWGYGNLQFKDELGNTVDSLWDGRCYDSVTFPEGISWLLNDWDPNEVFDFNLSDFQSIANDSFETWEAVPDANVAFVFGGFTDNVPHGDGITHDLPPSTALDGDNVIGFDELPHGVLGITYIFTLSDEFTFDPNDENHDNDPNFGGLDPNPDIPPGTYPAGTILDADILLNKDFADWSVAGERDKYDIQAVLVHEIGHFLGLCHSSVEYPFPAVMYPFITKNPEGLEQRTLKPDDLASVGTGYPGPTFTQNFGSISGSVTWSSNGVPIKGAQVIACSKASEAEVVSSYTDSSGTFFIQGLPPGEYILRVHPLIYEKERINEIIEAEYNGPFQIKAYPDEGNEWDAVGIQVTAGNTAANLNLEVTTVDAADSFEGDDAFTEAALLTTSGEAVFKTLYPTSDVDTMKFNASAGKAYRITSQGAYYDAQFSLYLYGPDQDLLLAQNCLPGAWVNYHCETGGLHYLQIKLRSGSKLPTGGVPYALSVRERDPIRYYVSTETGSDPAIISSLPAPYDLNDGDTLNISVDGTSTQVITFQADQFTDIQAATAEEIVDVINANLAGGQAEAVYTDPNMFLKISSLTPSPASIQILGGTARPALGLDLDLHSAGDGSPANPWAGIGYALASVPSDRIHPADIYIAEGTYYERVFMVPRVGLYGGFHPADWTRNIDSHPTIVHGGNQGSTITGCGINQIDGLVITRGTGTYLYQPNYGDNHWYMGGGIYATGFGNSPIVTRSLITDNLLFKEGSSQRFLGGGIYVGPGSATSLLYNEISRNYATIGGGACLYDSYSLVFHNRIHTNEITRKSAADGHGGGLYSVSNYYYRGNEIMHNAFYNNIGYWGGGCSATNSGEDIFSYNQVFGNTALGGGGGLGFHSGFGGGGMIIRHCIIAGNHTEAVKVIYSYGSGSGIYISGQGVELFSNIIVGNSANGDGGGIYRHYAHTASKYITNNVIVGNVAEKGGGLFSDYNDFVMLLNNTIAYNAGLSSGGGIAVAGTIYNRWRDAYVANNIIACNQGGGLVEYVDPNYPMAMKYNNFYGNSPGNYYDFDTSQWYETAENINQYVNYGPDTEVDHNVDWTPGYATSYTGIPEAITHDPNICQSVLTDIETTYEHNALAGMTINPDPNQPLHFYIVSNTETTITAWGDMAAVAESGSQYQIFDFHLAKDSMNINAGMDVSAYVDADIDGQGRPLYGAFDIGADEAYPIAGDFEPDEDVDLVDLDFFFKHWLNACAEPEWCDDCDVNQDEVVDLVDYGKIGAHWLMGAP